MRKILLTTSLAVVALCGVAQQKMDPRSQAIAQALVQLRQNPSSELQVVLPPYSPVDLTPATRGDQSPAVFVTMAPGVSFDRIADFGLQVEGTAGNMAVVSGALDDILALSNSDVVDRVAYGEILQTKLDYARTDIGLDKVHAGTSGATTTPFKGENVVCGIFDTGIDPNHINFYDMAFTGSRVKRVWYYSGSSGAATTYKDDKVINFDTDSKKDTHGTHTLGCMGGGFNMAGNGTLVKGSYAYINSSGNGVLTSSAKKCPYYGAAPASTLAVGCGQLYNVNITAAFSRIAAYAKDMGMPFVINLSAGSNVGPHDGSDDFSKFIDNLVDETGGIVCIAAGNEGEESISATKTLTNNDKKFITAIHGTADNSGNLQIYASDSRPFTVTMFIYDRGLKKNIFTKVIPSSGTTSYGSNNYTSSTILKDANFDKAFGSNSIVQITPNADTNCGRTNVSISFVSNYNLTTNPSRNYVLAFQIEGQAGQRIDAYHASTRGDAKMSSLNNTGWSDASPVLSISSMACAKSAIVVGAYNNKSKWGTTGKTLYSFRSGSGLTEIGAISPFTSYGVLHDGRSLPLVCGPGSGIVSSYNSYYTDSQEHTDMCASYTYKGRTYDWNAEQGTSMSTPFVAGVIATWLQANPNLKVADVKKIISDTSTPATGSLTSGQRTQWGAGKINPVEGLKAALRNGVSDIVANPSGVIVKDLGNNAFNIFSTGVQGMDVKVYGVAGTLAKQAQAAGDEIDVDLSSLAPGVYVMQINGLESHRVLVK